MITGELGWLEEWDLSVRRIGVPRLYGQRDEKYALEVLGERFE